jgi:hypothetical protein
VEPFLGVELALIAVYALLLEDYFWTVAVAAVIDVDVGRVNCEVWESLLSELVHLCCK